MAVCAPAMFCSLLSLSEHPNTRTGIQMPLNVANENKNMFNGFRAAFRKCSTNSSVLPFQLAPPLEIVPWDSWKRKAADIQQPQKPMFLRRFETYIHFSFSSAIPPYFSVPAYSFYPVFSEVQKRLQTEQRASA